MTGYQGIFDAFLKRVERDRSFFQYLNVSQLDAEEIVEERCLALLNEACGRIMLEGNPTVDFFDRDDDAQIFHFDLTGTELYLIPSLMYEAYLARDIAYLKNITVNYSPADVRVFDPSNWRSTFESLYRNVQADNLRYLDQYANRDRSDCSYIGVDFTSYNVDSL